MPATPGATVINRAELLKPEVTVELGSAQEFLGFSETVGTKYNQ